MRATPRALTFFVFVLAAGCAQPGERPAAQPAGASHAAAVERMAQMTDCEAGQAETILRTALASAAGPRQPESIVNPNACMQALLPGMPAQPAFGIAMPAVGPDAKKDFSTVLAKLAATHVPVTMQIDPHTGAVTIDSPALHVDGASVGSSGADLRKRVQAAESTSLVAELTQRMNPFGTALRSGVAASDNAHVFALQVIFTSTYAARHGGPDHRASDEAEVEKLLQSAARADRVVASATAVLASVQASLARHLDPAAVKTTAAGLGHALETPAEASPGDLETQWAAGEKEADELDAKIAEAESQSSPPASGIELDLGTVAAAASSETANDVGDVVVGVLALMHGDVAGVLKGASIFFPKDSPVRHGMRGVAAILHGDYRTALSEATHVVPADTEVGRLLATADAIVKKTQIAG